MQQRIHAALADIGPSRQIGTGVEIGVRAPSFRGSICPVVYERVQPAQGHVPIRREIEPRVKQRVRIPSLIGPKSDIMRPQIRLFPDVRMRG